MALSSSAHMITIDPRVYCETMNELHSYITSSKRGYLTQAELFRYYRQRHDNAEIPYRLLGYRSLLDLLGSDQRLFAIDLRREPAYVYSAVKLRQERRERQQGTTSFSRQHHSTNTLDEQRSTPSEYVFFDHHTPIPINDQCRHDHSNKELEFLDDAPIEVPLTPELHQYPLSNHWHTPPSEERTSSPINNQTNNEEGYETTSQVMSKIILSSNAMQIGSDTKDEPIIAKHENLSNVVQRKLMGNDENEIRKFSSIKDLTSSKYLHSNMNRSISTSTTSLSKSCSFQIIDLYIFLCAITASFLLLGVILYKIY